MGNLVNLEKKLQNMEQLITDLTLGGEVAQEQAVFWEKKAKALELELKKAESKVAALASVEQELELYKEKVGELAK